MLYQLIIDKAAPDQLRAIPKEIRRNMEGDERRYRLRVGDHRVLFRLDGKIIHVYAVKQRKEAYE